MNASEREGTNTELFFPQCTARADAVHCRKRVHNGIFGPPGTRVHVVFHSTTDLTDWTDCFLCETASKTKTKINPLARMEGVALMLCFRSGLIRASS